MKRIILIAALLAAASFPSVAGKSAWKPAGENIRTRWAAEVSPKNALKEYPRPQLVRAAWKNLNGLWDYAITPAAAEKMEASDGQILVPFCVESSLSGVGRIVTENDALWYKRSFRVPCCWKRSSKRVILHFDAVDWDCTVWVNGQELGRHTGGYTAFCYDITPYLVKGRQEVVLKVLDGTDNDMQPRGKQVRNPRSIWYTAVTGIWRTVWMESVPSAYVADYKVSPDVAGQAVSITPIVEGAAEGDLVKVELLAGGIGYNPEKPSRKVLAMNQVPVGETVTLSPVEAHLWSPDDPYLYGVRISLVRGSKTMDKVNAYTSIRSISDKVDADGHHRMALNGKILFQYGPLDQGWWPDGLYTAPTDEALRYDLEKTREMGFNMLRKHIKIEPFRWFYWCDVLGILVWQDMPSVALYKQREDWAQGADTFDAGNSDQLCPEARATFRKEWKEIMGQVDKFQCIVCWVPFNEAWGQFETADIVALTRECDSSRLINAASGGNWISGHVGDILDSHHYPDPKMRVWDDEMINVLGEYGGIGLPYEGHLWQKDRNWGYVKYTSIEEVTAKYEEYSKMLEPIAAQGCAAAVYTQTTDVEIEVNGLMTYDREVMKVVPERIAAANKAVIAIASE